MREPFSHLSIFAQQLESEQESATYEEISGSQNKRIGIFHSTLETEASVLKNRPDVICFVFVFSIDEMVSILFLPPRLC